ncbi:MAG: hypothetical protein ACHQ1E_12600 [Ktedonobacterales bacterium]
MKARRAWAWNSANRARVGILGLALLALTLAGCSLGGGSGSANSDQSLNALAWCDQPLISFQDDSQPSQQALTQWGSVKGQLGFTPYLPATLPKDSCLDLVGGSIHDPIFGAHLSITWVLPKTGPISFSEAPKRGAVSTTPQCAQSQQGSDATTVCIGALGDASITIASHLSESALQAYFPKLQPNVDWQPTAPAPTVTPTATATGN